MITDHPPVLVQSNAGLGREKRLMNDMILLLHTKSINIVVLPVTMQVHNAYIM